MMFKIKKVYRKRAMCFCTYHESSKNTADLEITLEGPFAGYWYCWGCGKSGKITDEELEKLRAMRTETQTEQPVKNWIETQTQYMNSRFTLRPANPFNISNMVLMSLGWGWDGVAHTFPERDANDNIIGILRRFPDRNKGVVAGSRRGLYIPRINFDSMVPLYITEGVSDLSVILECGLQGIARPTCNAGNDLVCQWLNNHNWIGEVIVIADNDIAGVEGANKLCNEINEHTNSHASYIIPDAKDVRELAETKEIECLKSWLNLNN